ncbi:manganese-dependent inorganic pyrophosphatase [Texcoconibacillus texcoconensis]|uniref:Probable manganese-dependent inorganic pyrophosphatase n=1 Tax=Texcoconibacillus texcoconensis TaxID=1095777 RepID=A0A840QSH2_9BACI|nr:manganese-dependent inorganic pyrophosphatase [Texcoconibacillus texcoconensis]MBB5174263.1 manganese-dependent inorganic pyrophosphatase [Texcoconibacillus texcoconensis]
MREEKVFVFGHQSPDTDSICSAIVYTHLKKVLGLNAEPVRLGEINKETEYVLNYFEVEEPQLRDEVSEEVSQVILVDHNERQQSVSDLDKVQILEVIDHHRIANFETESPLYYRAEPVGCTTTILYKLFKEQQVEIEPKIAGLMLSAIISDTLLFKSPTCTPEDEKVAQELASIANVNLEEYGLDMLKAGADMQGKSIEEILTMDKKEFSMGEHKVQVAQVNVIDENDILIRKKEVEEEMNRSVDGNELDLFVLAVTNILSNNTVALAVGEQQQAVEKAFDVSLEDGQATLEGVVSRKKQIVPQLTQVLS